MSNQDDLAWIAQRLRTVTDGERNMHNLLVTLRLWGREAISLGAFAGVRFAEFRDFFDIRHDNKPNHSAPLAMLFAMQWLAKNGGDIDLAMPKDVQPFEIPKLGYPGRAVLRPHVHAFADLIESAGRGGTDERDGHSDTPKKFEKKSKRRQLNGHGTACIKEFKAYKRRGDPQTMLYVVKEYVAEHPEVSEAALYRSLTDNSDQWKPTAG
jgi:hypothetical protein